MQIQLYDTTLRDGTQREGLSLSAEDKIKIARELFQRFEWCLRAFHGASDTYPYLDEVAIAVPGQAIGWRTNGAEPFAITAARLLRPRRRSCER